MAHPAPEPVQRRRPAVEMARQVLTKGQPGVVPRHLPEPRQRGTLLRAGREVPRPEAEIAPDLPYQPVAVDEPQIQGPRVAEPSLDQEAVAVARDQGVKPAAWSTRARSGLRSASRPSPANLSSQVPPPARSRNLRRSRYRLQAGQAASRG
jgi:hypothetical protein